VIRLTATASGLAIAMLLAAPAFAQESAGAEDEIVVTAQKNNQTQISHGGSVGVLGDKAAEDVPFSVKSYNAALILNQQPQTLGQVLENDPSIRTTYGYGIVGEQFIVRGFTLYGDDIGFGGLYGITPRQLVSPELYESVQVLNGASAFLNGAAPGGSGIGGSVNLTPKRAGATDLNRVTIGYTSGSHFGGSFDTSRRFGDGAWGVRINGGYRSGNVGVDDEFRRSVVVGGALDYQGSSVRLALDLAYQRFQVRHLRPKVTIGTSTIPRVPAADANYGQAFSYTTTRDIFGSVSGEWDVSDNAMLYAKFGARDGAEDSITDGITINNLTTGAATGNALYVPRTDNNEAAVAGLRVKLAAGGITHEINFGGSHIWQVNRNAYEFLWNGPLYPGFATNLYNTPQASLPTTSSVGGNLSDPYPMSRSRLGSAFASDTIGFWDDRLLITAGLRLQSIQTRSYSAATGAESGRVRTSGITPVVGVVVKPVSGVSLFANRIEGLQQGAVAPAGTVNAGQIFNPFQSVQYEVGGKLNLGALNASVALYQIDQPSGYTITEGALQRYGVFGEQRNRGIELSLDGELAPGLRLIAGGTIVDPKLRKNQNTALNGHTAQGVPDYTANANVEWDVAATGVTLTGRVVHTGKQMVNVANTLELPTWTRFDLGARYVVAVAEKPVTLRFNVDNVANKRYWASAYDAFSQALLQGAPRTYKASASIDF
jgi:iron complex outermembrane recepter protein